MTETQRAKARLECYILEQWPKPPHPLTAPKAAVEYLKLLMDEIVMAVRAEWPSDRPF